MQVCYYIYKMQPQISTQTVFSKQHLVEAIDIKLRERMLGDIIIFILVSLLEILQYMRMNIVLQQNYLVVGLIVLMVLVAIDYFYTRKNIGQPTHAFFRYNKVCVVLTHILVIYDLIIFIRKVLGLFNIFDDKRSFLSSDARTEVLFSGMRLAGLFNVLSRVKELDKLLGEYFSLPEVQPVLPVSALP